MDDFVECFAGVDDPRRANARHNLHELLIIALCTVLCGGEDCSDMALFGQSKEPSKRSGRETRRHVAHRGCRPGATAGVS